MNTAFTPIQVDPGQMSFDPLDFEDQGLTREEAVTAAKAARQVIVSRIRKERSDLTAKCWVLTGQLRKYKSFGVPDGRYRNVYYITIREA